MNKSKHIDQGVGSVLFDAMGKPIESSDAKNARSLSTFDGFNRPVNGWSQNNSSDSLRLTAHAIYGETATNPKDKNLLGQLWQQYDESGKVESIEFDFKQNLLSKKQKVISSTELKSSLDNYQTYLVDWTGLPNILGTQEFETSSDFDALNRPIKISLPENVNTERKEIVPTYNRAGGLEKVHYDNTEYVNNIVYNAKGQRLLIAFGNDVMTRYVYSNSTFRLLRQKSEKFTYSHTGSNHTYTPLAGTKRQDDGFNFDLLGNIMKILHRTTDCGISGSILGSDALNREFEYDPLYRATSANGRESDTQNQNDYLYADAPNPGTPNSNNVRAYTRKYSFDKLGNVQQVKQLGTNGFTRNFVYHTGKNTLQKIETAAPALLEDFTYDVCGNQLTAGTTRNYVWNAANQLITYKNQVGSNDPTIFAQYDYSGMNRVSKMVKTGSAGSPVYERTIYIDGVFEYHILENGTTYEKNYVHVMDDASRIAMVRIGAPFPDDIADSITYNLEDQIGSSSIRLNTSGGVIDKEEYYPFGDSSLRTFSKKRYRYVGKEKDLESGLYYYGARYYTAWTCRFISIDPLAADYPYLTPYNYAGNKPINDKDIDGLQSTKDQKVNNSGGTNIIGPPVNSGEKNKKGEEAANNTTQNMNLHQVYPDGMIPQPGDLPTDLSHLIGSDIYYEARAFDFELRNPEAPVPEYYRDYGHKYLHEFKYETKENLSPEGQIWLEDALINLQLAIEDGLKNNPNIESNSKEFSDFAFETHVDAYVDAGILSLSIIDKVKITLTVEPKDLLSDRGLAQASQVATEQLSMYINHPKFAAKQAGEVILGISNGTIDKEVDKYLEENMGYAVDRSIWKIMLPF